MMNSASFADSLLTLSHSANTLSQPSSLVRAVSSANVVGRRVALDARDLAKIIYGMRAVAGAPADTQKEQPAAVRPDLRQQRGDSLDRRRYPACE